MRKLAFTILLFSLAACQLKKNRITLNTGMEGKPLASFQLLLPDSLTKINTASIPDGKPIVLVYFSPYCPFCRAEIADIVKNTKVLDGARVYLLTNFPLRILKAFDSAYHLGQIPAITTGQDYAQAFAAHYKSPGIPVTAIFDIKKKLKEAFVGRMTAAQIGHAAGLN